MLRFGVAGAGFMGALHCKAYSSFDDIKFAGIFDADENRAEEISAKYGVEAFDSLEDLIKNVDAVSLAAPTILHFDLAMKCIDAGIHLLIEKPIAGNISQAKEIIEKAAHKKLVAAVGYIERFNPVVLELLNAVKGKKIRSIEAVRHAPKVNRANDVSAVFDLMIHDIDIVLAAAKKNVKTVCAIGERIDSPVFNKVDAELVFEGGIKAILSTSKVAQEKVRTIKMVCDEMFIEADLLAKTIKIVKDGKSELSNIEGQESIIAEVRDFIDAVKGKKKPKISAKDSFRSFEIAWDIEERITLP